MANNYNESEFMKKLKRICKNRAVIVTFITLLAAIGVIVAVTVSANRAKRPIGDGKETGHVTGAVTSKDDKGVIGKGDESMAIYNGGETQPNGSDKTPAQISFTLPVSGKLVKNHDAAIQVYSATMGDYRVHLGVDISTAENASICATAAGTVEKIWDDPMMGTCVAISHEGDIVTIYKNLASTLGTGITEGATVKAGQTIGCVGDTAIAELADEPHLHYEMTVGGIAVDPLKYFAVEDVAKLTSTGADSAYESSAVTGK